MSPDPAEELFEILDELAFHITSARAAGLQRVDALRAELKKARDLIADADALAADTAAVKRAEEEGD